MFGDNHKISRIQMERQYQLTFLAPLLLFASKEMQGGMGILAVCITMPFVWLALVFMKRTSGMCRKMEKNTEGIGSKLRVFSFQVFLVVAGVFVAAHASRLITEYMVPGIPRGLVIVIFVLASLALGSQLEVRGRFAEIAWPVVSILVGIFFFFAFWQGVNMLFAQNVDFGQAKIGFWNFSWSELWKKVLTLLVFMAGTVLVSFDDVRQEKGDTKNSFLFRMVLKLTIWLVLAIVLQQMYFGIRGLEDLNYPMLDLMSGVKLPGNFVRRLDLIFLTVLLFALLFTMGSICFYSGYLWKKVNISMGRFPIVALIFALVLTLSGCQIVEPEKRAYPLVLGIDWTGEEYAIYLAMAKMAQSTGQEKSGSEQDANMIVLQGKDSREIQEAYDASEELFLDVGHVQALVFGEQLLMEEERAAAILKELEQNHDLGNSPYVFATDDMEELFSKNGKEIASLGDYLKGLYENRIQQRTPRTLLDVYRVLHNEDRLPEIPKLKVSKEKVELVNFAAWQERQMQKEIASEILRFHVQANSDLSEDQEEKMQVKHAIAEYLRPVLEQADSKETAVEYLQNHLYNIEEIAQKIVDSRQVEVSLKEDWFPTISYGDCTFPEGIYDALCVKIGEAKGHNWWCVLYPGLCFSSAIQPAVTEEDKSLLKDVLDEDCYQFLLRPAKTKIRFRLFGLEFFRENR